MRFYAVCTKAIALTHQALQTLDQGRKGSGRASRALRVATLYGHLQCKARDGQLIRISCRDLAHAWHVQTRELRADLQDLAAIGWLHYTSGPLGLAIRLHEPDELVDVDAGAVASEPLDHSPAEQQEAAGSEHNLQREQQPRVIVKAPPEPSNEPERSPEMNPLISQFAATYNQHKPQTWPAYKPTGNALAGRLQRAIRHAGGTEAFWSVLIQALRSMPEFWLSTYPKGRSGTDCAMALLCADRKAAGLGVELWHVFAWGAYSQRHSGGIGGNTPGVGRNRPAVISGYHPDHRRACELLAWDGHQWKGRGMEAANLPASELQRLAEILEAAGFGKPGTAAEQFAQEARR